MGIRGAAIATVIAQAVSAIWVVHFLTGPQAALKIRRNKLAVRWARLKKIMALGASTFVMAMTTSTVQVIYNISLRNHGGDVYIGVMTIINSVREIFHLPVSGLSNGSIPVISYNYGSKAFGRVKQAIRFLTIAGIGYTTFAWLIIFLFPELFMRIFTSDPELIATGIPSLRTYFFGFFMMALQTSGQFTFLGLGKAKQAIFFSIFRKVILVAPLALILPRIGGLGVSGVFWAEPISNVIGGTLCFVTMMLTVLPELKNAQKLNQQD
jgi:Na+-driven multidrug efflux pump